MTIHDLSKRTISIWATYPTGHEHEQKMRRAVIREMGTKIAHRILMDKRILTEIEDVRRSTLLMDVVVLSRPELQEILDAYATSMMNHSRGFADPPVLITSNIGDSPAEYTPRPEQNYSTKELVETIQLLLPLVIKNYGRDHITSHAESVLERYSKKEGV